MKGLAPLDREAQNSKSTCLLHQGTEMVNAEWPLAGGRGPDGRPADDRSQRELCLTAQCWGGGFQRHLRKQVRGDLPLHSEIWGPWAPPTLPYSPNSSPQSLRRATLAEAKFTFLCGAWGCVQSLGSTEPRIVVMGGPG